MAWPAIASSLLPDKLDQQGIFGGAFLQPMLLGAAEQKGDELGIPGRRRIEQRRGDLDLGRGQSGVERLMLAGDQPRRERRAKLVLDRADEAGEQGQDRAALPLGQPVALGQPQFERGAGQARPCGRDQPGRAVELIAAPGFGHGPFLRPSGLKWR